MSPVLCCSKGRGLLFGGADAFVDPFVGEAAVFGAGEIFVGGIGVAEEFVNETAVCEEGGIGSGTAHARIEFLEGCLEIGFGGIVLFLSEAEFGAADQPTALHP